MKKKIIFIGALLLTFVLAAVPSDAKKRRDAEPEVKYVFFFIGDGMGINTVHGTQLYNRATGNGPENVNFLHFPVRTFVTTFSATSLVTDSAAGGTALATGSKANDYTIGVNPDLAEVTNISEWVKDMGYGVGVATSVALNHATPAAFYAHAENRDFYTEIIDDFIACNVDFLAGGGMYAEKKGPTEDEMEKKVAESGITVMRGAEMENSEDVDGRLMCMSGVKQGALEYAIDQKEGDTGLSDFVDAGLEYLVEHYGDKGFFFMIEGGKIDYATHGNDAVGAFHEVNDFAAAIDKAVEFYNAHPEETLIVVSSDHDTGGMVLGTKNYKIDLAKLSWQKESEDALTRKFRSQFKDKAPEWEEVKTFLSDNLGLWSHVKVDKDFEDRLRESVEEMAKQGGDSGVENLYSVNSKIVYDAVIYLAAKAGVNWTSSAHSGAPVGLFVMGPKAELFNACTDNTDIPKTIAKVAGYKML